MASYDELSELDDIDDLIDNVYDLEGYGDVRKAYDELSGYDVYRQWIEPELVEKALSPKQLQQRRDAAKSRARKAGANGGMADRMRARQGYKTARNMQVGSPFNPVLGVGRGGRRLAAKGKPRMFRNSVRNAAFENQMAAQGMELRGNRKMTALAAFKDKGSRSIARKRRLKHEAASLALAAAALGGHAAYNRYRGPKPPSDPGRTLTSGRQARALPSGR